MSAFTPGELEYPATNRPGRLATAAPHGTRPHHQLRQRPTPIPPRQPHHPPPAPPHPLTSEPNRCRGPGAEVGIAAHLRELGRSRQTDQTKSSSTSATAKNRSAQ